MRSSGPSIVVAAQPEALTIEPTRAAVIVVDMQNDFGAAGGMFALGGIDISAIRAAVVPTARVLAAARRAGIPVIYLKMGFQPDLSDAGAPDSAFWLKHLKLRTPGERVETPDGSEGRILVRDTWNTDILPELAPEPGDTIVYKSRFSGFFRTELDEILRRRGVRDLIFTGCTTSVCVESTLRDAVYRDYTCLLLSDCTAEPIGAHLPRGNHEASLLVVQALFGWVATSDAFLAVLEGEIAAPTA